MCITSFDVTEELEQRSANVNRVGLHPRWCDGQLFDERGHPVNVRSRVFSRSMRRAQNEILSIVGVCVRDIPQSRHDEAISRHDLDVDLMQRTAQENMYGLVLRLIGAILQCSCLWWIESFRQRLLASL